METTSKQFNLIIAYLIPGFIGLVGLVPLVPIVGHWLQPVNQGDLGFGPPVYAILAAIALGMLFSSIRWMLIDHIHHFTGIKPPKLRLLYLESRLEAFNYIVENKYRYYQHHANGLIALLWAYLPNRILQTSPLLGLGTDLGVLFLCAVLFATSRDELARYYADIGQLVGPVAEKAGDDMSNGYHHESGGGAPSKPRPESKPEGKTVAPVKPDDAKNKGGAASK